MSRLVSAEQIETYAADGAVLLPGLFRDWVETIRAMAAQGVTHVVECGPGKVLAGLVKRIDPRLQGIAAADRASLEQALAAIKGV